jgi:Xaa-Pro aminopeptidase
MSILSSAPRDQKIKENMIIAVEPKMIYPGKGVVGVEDAHLVRAEGAESLTRPPGEIWRV